MDYRLPECERSNEDVCITGERPKAAAGCTLMPKHRSALAQNAERGLRIAFDEQIKISQVNQDDTCTAFAERQRDRRAAESAGIVEGRCRVVAVDRSSGGNTGAHAITAFAPGFFP